MDYQTFLDKVNTAYKPKPKSLDSSSGVVGISEENCLEVLHGEHESLSDAFTWGSTPQGSDYWVDRYDGDVLLTQEDYEFIRGLIE